MPKNYHIFLKGEVGSKWSGNFTSDMVSWILDKNKDTEVNVLINSLGGYTHEGLAISSLFKIHGNVHVHFIGQSASAATIAAMGAKRISIDADAAFLVHRCSNLVFEWDFMNADQLDEHIKKLEKQKAEQQTIDTIVAGLYARRCKKTKDELLQLMSKDTWLTAKEALEWGFVDEITDEVEDKEPLTESTAAALSSAGMPLPPGYKGKKGSIMNRFFEFLRSFNHQDSEDVTISDEQESESESHNSLSMEQDSTKMELESKTLAPAQPEHQDEQLAADPATEQALSAKDEEIASLRAKIAELDKTISELRKEPAEPTSDVVEAKKEDPDPYAPVSKADGIAASKAFLSHFS